MHISLTRGNDLVGAEETVDCWLYDKANVYLQKANLSLHLTLAEKDFIRAIPSESFDGLAIIDYEEWRPVFSMNWGSKRIYQDKSIEYVYNRTGKISKRMAIALATAEFEKYAL